MEISLISYRGLAIMLIVTHQRVMPIIIADNHFDGNTRGESRELRATRREHVRSAVEWKNARSLLSRRGLKIVQRTLCISGTRAPQCHVCSDLPERREKDLFARNRSLFRANRRSLISRLCTRMHTDAVRDDNASRDTIRVNRIRSVYYTENKI